MQLNSRVPKHKEQIVRAVDDATKRSGRPKSEIVLEALETYLANPAPTLGTFHLGDVTIPSRDELYVDRPE